MILHVHVLVRAFWNGRVRNLVLVVIFSDTKWNILSLITGFKILTLLHLQSSDIHDIRQICFQANLKHNMTICFMFVFCSLFMQILNSISLFFTTLLFYTFQRLTIYTTIRKESYLIQCKRDFLSLEHSVICFVSMVWVPYHYFLHLWNVTLNNLVFLFSTTWKMPHSAFTCNVSITSAHHFNPCSNHSVQLGNL